MNHAKKILVLRQLLIGHRYFNALRALTFAQSKHTGTRKDKVTPEFDHQISMALFALTLPDIQFREELIATIMLHDVQEDYDVTSEEIRDIFIDPVEEFAIRVSDAVWCMTKTYRGSKRDETEVFHAMALNIIASIAKGCDRIHNLSTMVGVFTVVKQRQYIGEARDLILPMIKKAKRNFPEQTSAYENLKWMMRSQLDLIELALEARMNNA